MDPVTGALILGGASGLLGGFGGLFGGSAEADAARKAQKDLEAAKKQYDLDYEQNLGYLNDLIGGYGDQTGLYGSKIDEMLGQGVGQYKAGEFGVADVNKWLAPDINYRIQRATEAVENSAAGRNKLLSGATQQAISDRSQQIAQEAWDKAVSAGLNAFQANEAAKQAEAQGGQYAINTFLSKYNSNLGAKTGLESQGLQMRQEKADQDMNYGIARSGTRTAKSSDPTSGAFWAQGFQGFMQGASPWATAFGNAWGQRPVAPATTTAPTTPTTGTK